MAVAGIDPQPLSGLAAMLSNRPPTRQTDCSNRAWAVPERS